MGPREQGNKRAREHREQGSKKTRLRDCGLRLRVAAMRDDVALDAVVDLAGKYAVLEKVRFGAIGTKAHDAAGPTGRHTGNLEEFFHVGVIDVDACRGWWSGFGLGSGLWRVGLRKAWNGWRAGGKAEDQERGEERRELLAEYHAIIVCLRRRGRNTTNRFCPCDDVRNEVRNRRAASANKSKSRP